MDKDLSVELMKEMGSVPFSAGSPTVQLCRSKEQLAS
jgi:hypothetical protein